MVRNIGLGLLAILLILQFVGPSRPEVIEDNPGDILLASSPSVEIAGTLRSACYDCHSMETKYPWYGYVAPISWYLIEHIEHGREELNFSTWTDLDKRAKLRVLKDIQEEVEEKKMPLESYADLHEEAELTEEQRASIVQWAKALAIDVLKQK
ncbi:MAG: heme-binding domain-containing protein [Marinoscillum sp.]